MEEKKAGGTLRDPWSTVEWALASKNLVMNHSLGSAEQIQTATGSHITFHLRIGWRHRSPNLAPATMTSTCLTTERIECVCVTTKHKIGALFIPYIYTLPFNHRFPKKYSTNWFSKTRCRSQRQFWFPVSRHQGQSKKGLEQLVREHSLQPSQGVSTTLDSTGCSRPDCWRLSSLQGEPRRKWRTIKGKTEAHESSRCKHNPRVINGLPKGKACQVFLPSFHHSLNHPSQFPTSQGPVIRKFKRLFKIFPTETFNK